MGHGGMDKPQIVNVIQSLSGYSLADLQQLGKAVEQAVRVNLSAAVGQSKNRPPCPVCKSENPYRWGKSGTDQRWRCRTCGKTYANLTGTPLAYAKKRPELLEAAKNMLGDDPLSCRKLGELLGVNRMTAWRWRLKILRSLDSFGDTQLRNLVEADETFFRESRKGSREWALHHDGDGPAPPRPRWRDYDRLREPLPRGLSRWQIPILVLRDRTGKTCSRRLASLKHASFEPVLDEAMAPDALLCTDGGAVYRKWAKSRNRAVEQVNTKRGIHVRNGVFHIQNANSYHSRLKDFMRPFRGPAARYLTLYVGWMAFRDRLRVTTIIGNPLIDRLLKHKRQPDETRKGH